MDRGEYKNKVCLWAILLHIMDTLTNSKFPIAQFRIFQCICEDFIFKQSVKQYKGLAYASVDR